LKTNLKTFPVISWCKKCDKDYDKVFKWLKDFEAELREELRYWKKELGSYAEGKQSLIEEVLGEETT
jgi:hypothetical protein